MEEKERYEWNSRFDEAIKDNQTGDIVNAVEVLNKQDKRIKELEETLVKARQREIIIHQNYKQGYAKDYEEMNNLKEEIEGWREAYLELKQQLRNLPKKIVEEIRKEIELPLYVHPDFDEFECVFDIDKLLDTILKKYGGENDL